MPIKYNLTKYDILAEQIHELSQKRNTPFTKDEETLKAEATIIASFSPAHSWQTHKIMTEGSQSLLGSSVIRDEYSEAKREKWKHVTNTHIREVACTGAKLDGMFPAWLALAANETNGVRETYKTAWANLKQIFDEECDSISIRQV